VGGLEDAVLAWVHRFGLVLGGFAPEQEDHVFALGVNHFDHMVGKFLPAAFGVRVGFAVLYGEGGVQEENTLFGPFAEVSVRWGARDLIE
jgi:hypothetical protein